MDFIKNLEPIIICDIGASPSTETDFIDDLFENLKNCFQMFYSSILLHKKYFLDFAFHPLLAEQGLPAYLNSFLELKPRKKNWYMLLRQQTFRPYSLRTWKNCGSFENFEHQAVKVLQDHL